VIPNRVSPIIVAVWMPFVEAVGGCRLDIGKGQDFRPPGLWFFASVVLFILIPRMILLSLPSRRQRSAEKLYSCTSWYALRRGPVDAPTFATWCVKARCGCRAWR